MIPGNQAHLYLVSMTLMCSTMRKRNTVYIEVEHLLSRMKALTNIYSRSETFANASV